MEPFSTGLYTNSIFIKKLLVHLLLLVILLIIKQPQIHRAVLVKILALKTRQPLLILYVFRTGLLETMLRHLLALAVVIEAVYVI